VALEFPQVEAEASVIEDDRHGQRHQRLERGTQQPFGVDIGRERTRDETGRKQHDERRDTQPAGHYLGADREYENQADADQDLVGGHPSLR
jgi:hypothetical protein